MSSINIAIQVNVLLFALGSLASGENYISIKVPIVAEGLGLTPVFTVVAENAVLLLRLPVHEQTAGGEEKQ